MSQYIKEQIEEMLQANSDNAYPIRMKICGDDGKTKWMSITRESAKRIAEVAESCS